MKTGVEQKDGSTVARQRGTPQGVVIFLLLANIYLHHCSDKWMDAINPGNPFEMYADDIVVHCNSKLDAERLLEKLKERMIQFRLGLHPEKTKVVYCKDYRRKESHDSESFTFLSYTFAPRTIKSKYDPTMMILIF